MRETFNCKEWKQYQYLKHLKVCQLAIITLQTAKATAIQIEAFKQVRECTHDHTAAAESSIKCKITELVCRTLEVGFENSIFPLVWN